MTKEEAPVARRGNWMQVSGGQAFWPLDPRPEEINFETVGSALAKICRYGGHTTSFYSVAEHCVRISYWLEKTYGDQELALKGLIHDGAEAYVGDMVRPLKHSIPEFRNIENRILEMMHSKLNLSFDGDLDPLVADADNRILLDERARFLEDPPYLWWQDITGIYPLGIEWVDAWSWRDARAEWLRRFEELGGQF